MSYLTSVKTINGETSGFYQYPIKYVATSAEAADSNTLYVLTGSNYGVIVPTLFFNAVDTLNPLGLPSNTIRVKLSSGFTPTEKPNIIGDTQTLVDADANIWDIYKENNDWTRLFQIKSSLLEVLGANTTNVTSMFRMFETCTNLTAITLFDTSNVTDMDYMFLRCSGISSVPLFDTSNVTTMEAMFKQCYNVQSGALALYNQASSQTTPPINHYETFLYCGRDTQTGSAELAQIPASWGGWYLEI